MSLREIMKRGWYHAIDDEGGGSPPGDDADDADLDDADGADDADDADDQGDDADDSADDDADGEPGPDPAPQALTPQAIAQAILEAQKLTQKSEVTDDTPQFDWSDPIGSIQKIVAESTKAVVQDTQKRGALEGAILSQFSKNSAEAQAFARQVLAGTPTGQLEDPNVATGLRLMVKGFEAERGVKKVKSTVKTEPRAPTNATNVPANLKSKIAQFEKAFPHLKGRMTAEKAKAYFAGE